MSWMQKGSKSKSFYFKCEFVVPFRVFYLLVENNILQFESHCLYWFHQLLVNLEIADKLFG